MPFSNGLSANISLYPVTPYELKGYLFKNNRYGDAGHMIGDEDLSSRDFDILEKIEISIRAIAILDVTDLDRDRLWQKVRGDINMLIECGWVLSAGAEQGAIYVRLYSPSVAHMANADSYDLEVRNEDERAFSVVDSWLKGLDQLRQ